MHLLVLSSIVALATSAEAADRPILHERVDFERDETRVALPGEVAAPGDAEPVVRPDSSTMAPDEHTDGDDELVYNVVWNPSVAPFKRGRSFDRVLPDGQLALPKTNRRVQVPVVGGRVDPGRELFRGSMMVALVHGQPAVVPTPAADLRILEARTNPDVPIRFSRDSADNLYVEPLSPRGQGSVVRLALVVDARSDYFGGPAARPAKRLAHPLPPGLRQKGRDVLREIPGAAERAPLAALIQWFREFKAGPFPGGSGDLYLDLALSQIGVCRHRSYAFVITAQAAGIPARFVANEAHAFVEVRLKDQGWRRVDLGGAARSFDLRNPGDSPPHRPLYGDPYPKPAAYRASSDAGGPPRLPTPGGDPAGQSSPGGANEPGGDTSGLGVDTTIASDSATDPATAPVDEAPPGADPLPTPSLPPLSVAPEYVELLEIPITLTPASTQRDKRIRVEGRAPRPFKLALFPQSGDRIVHEWREVRPDEAGAYSEWVQIPSHVPPGRYRVLAIIDRDP